MAPLLTFVCVAGEPRRSNLRRTALPNQLRRRTDHDPLEHAPLTYSRSSADIFPRSDADAYLQHCRGTISTYQSSFESVRSGKAHGSLAGECLGTGLWTGRALLDQR